MISVFDSSNILTKSIYCLLFLDFLTYYLLEDIPDILA